jgi:hypothetical protein
MHVSLSLACRLARHFLMKLGERMRSTSPLLAMVAALVLFASVPVAPIRAAEVSNATVAPLPAVATDDGRFGMVQGLIDPDMAYKAGARWDRIVFPWSLIQKDGPNSWTELYFTDEQIRTQQRRGVTMAGVIIATPQWASTTPEKGRPVDPPRGLELAYNDPNNTWGQFVRKLAAREKGVVDHWIIWNEQDMFTPALRYTFDGSYEQYAQLLKVAYLNIKEVNPNAKVIIGGFAYWWDKEYNRPPYLGPLLEVIKRDPDRDRNNHYFDIVSVHSYTAPLNSFTEPMIMKDILTQRGMTKPIWISESNVIPYDDLKNALPSGQLRGSLDQQASYVIQAMALSIAAGTERYAVYKAVDEKPENDIELWGLIRNDHTVKPSYVAFQVGATYFTNVKSAVFSWPGVDKPTPDQYRTILASNESRLQFVWPSQVSQVTMERGDHRTIVTWNNSPEAVTHKIAAAAKSATLVHKNGATETISAKNGYYSLDLAPSSHNADPRDASLYLIGGDPLIIDEVVKPLPTDRLSSRIEVVWPINSAPIEEATRANVVAQLITPGTNDPVACRYDPDPEDVQLFAWRHYLEKPIAPVPSVVVPSPSLVPGSGLTTPSTVTPGTGTTATPSADPSPTPPPAVEKQEPEKVLLGTGTRRFVTTQDGLTYPVWDFNNVDISYARTADKDHWLELFVAVDGIKMDPVPWMYGGPNNQDWQGPRIQLASSCQ